MAGPAGLSCAHLVFLALGSATGALRTCGWLRIADVVGDQPGMRLPRFSVASLRRWRSFELSEPYPFTAAFSRTASSSL